LANYVFAYFILPDTSAAYTKGRKMIVVLLLFYFTD